MWVFNGVTIHTIHSCHVQLAAFLGLKRQQDAMNTSKSCLVRAAFQSNKMMQNCGWNHWEWMHPCGCGKSLHDSPMISAQCCAVPNWGVCSAIRSPTKPIEVSKWEKDGKGQQWCMKLDANACCRCCSVEIRSKKFCQLPALPSFGPHCELALKMPGFPMATQSGEISQPPGEHDSHQAWRSELAPNPNNLNNAKLLSCNCWKGRHDGHVNFIKF